MILACVVGTKKGQGGGWGVGGGEKRDRPALSMPATQASLHRRQSGQVVSVYNSQSGGPGFESRSGNLLDLFSVIPSSNPWPCLLIANWLPPASWGF